MAQLLNRFALFYPMRLAATCFMIVVTSLYAFQFDRFTSSYYVLLTCLGVYPQVVHSLPWIEKNPGLQRHDESLQSPLERIPA